MNILLLIVGLIVLLLGGEFLLRASVAAAARWQVPKVIIGMTLVSFATSLPELMTSIRAALDGYPDLSLGNVVGSNIANPRFAIFEPTTLCLLFPYCCYYFFWMEELAKLKAYYLFRCSLL